MLVSWQPSELGAQLAVQRGESSVRAPAEIGRHTVAPQLRPPKGDAANWNPSRSTRTPRTHHGSPSINRASRSARSGPANRIELLDDPARPELANQVGHRGDAKPAAPRNVVAAACSMVAYVAKDLG